MLLLSLSGCAAHDVIYSIGGLFGNYGNASDTDVNRREEFRQRYEEQSMLATESDVAP
jgi:hypothetical protein